MARARTRLVNSFDQIARLQVLHALAAVVLFSVGLATVVLLSEAGVARMIPHAVEVTLVRNATASVARMRRVTPKVSVVTLATLWLFPSALRHAVMALPLPAVRRYWVRVLDAETDAWRWAEYALTASVMVVASNIVTGQVVAEVIGLQVVLNVLCQVLGGLHEALWSVRAGGVISDAHAHALLGAAWLAFGGTWGTTLAVYARNARASGPPDWVHGVMATMTLFLVAFGAVHARNAFSRTASYASTEVLYTVLSFVSKSNLALFLAFGLRSFSEGEGH